jgi:hypothetical protein
MFCCCFENAQQKISHAFCHDVEYCDSSENNVIYLLRKYAVFVTLLRNRIPLLRDQCISEIILPIKNTFIVRFEIDSLLILCTEVHNSPITHIDASVK